MSRDGRVRAAEWLTTYLAKHGRTSRAEIKQAAQARAISDGRLLQAATDMGVVKKDEHWELPDDVKQMLGVK